MLSARFGSGTQGATAQLSQWREDSEKAGSERVDRVAQERSGLKARRIVVQLVDWCKSLVVVRAQASYDAV